MKGGIHLSRRARGVTCLCNLRSASRLFTQGCNFAGRKSDETDAVPQLAGYYIVVPTIKHSVFGHYSRVYDVKISLFADGINRIVDPSERYPAIVHP